MSAAAIDRDRRVADAFDARLRERLRRSATPELIAEHAASPRQPSADLLRLADYFRRGALEGKYVVVATRQSSEYRVGVLAGGRGTPVEIEEARYPTARDAHHAIFLRRLREIGVEVA